MFDILLNAEIFKYGGFILLAFLISLPVSWILSKISKKLIFALPILLALLGIVFMIMGVLAESWGPVIFLIMAMFTFLAFVGAMASSVLLNIRDKDKKK
jgi:ABC-type multidrug transport system permease subunit